MAEKDGRRSGRRTEPRRDGFQDRDLLVGRQQGASASGQTDATGHGQSPKAGGELPATPDETLAHMLATLRRMKARLDVLQASPEASDEATVTLKRAEAQLNKAVQDARGALAAAAAPDAKRRHEEAVSAALLTDGAQALKDRAGEIERRLEQSRERETALDGAVAKLVQAADDLRRSLGSLQSELDRREAGRRRRRWLAGGGVAVAVAVSLVVGAMVQRETGVLTLGDPRHAWIAYAARHYAPRLAACASRARLDNEAYRCTVHVEPPRTVTIPFFPWGPLTVLPPDG